MGKHRNNSGQSSADYEVGYGKPPKHSRFQPGFSGNKKGRPRQHKTLSEERREIMRELVPVTLNGKTIKLPRQTVILRSLIGKAMQGDLPTARLLFALDSAPDAATSIGIPDELSPEDRALLADFIRMTEQPAEFPAPEGASASDASTGGSEHA